MSRSETIKRNKLISNFVYQNFKVSAYRNWSGRIYKYFSNIYVNCKTIKFAIFQEVLPQDKQLVEKFLEENNITYKAVKFKPSYGYKSLIISFDN